MRCGELRADVVVEAIEHGDGDGTKRDAALRQPDPVSTPVRRVALSADKPRRLHQPNERRHRLLRQTRADGESAHAQAVLFEQRE